MAQTLDGIVRWTGEKHLDENNGVINVLPRVERDSRGGFVVTDIKEHQVRLYGLDGELRDVLGRSGRGPGEFQYPSSALRLTDGRLLVAELGGTLSLFDSTGSFLRSVRVPVRSIMDMHELPDGTILVAGISRVQEANGKVYLLHRVHVQRGEIMDHFFPMPTFDSSYRGALLSLANLVACDVRDSTIVAAFSPVPGLHFFDLAGNQVKHVDLSLRAFRPMELPDSPLKMTRANVAEWYATFSTVESIYWIENGILLQYYDRVNPRTRDLKWKVALVDWTGNRLFERSDTPQLLTVDPETSRLYFVHPESETPERWAVGEIVQK
jgi:hypothetical protein